MKGRAVAWGTWRLLDLNAILNNWNRAEREAAVLAQMDDVLNEYIAKILDHKVNGG